MKAIDRPQLTDRQAESLATIRKHWLKLNCSPTARYIRKKMGSTSLAEGALYHARALVKKGYLRGVTGYAAVPKQEKDEGHVPTSRSTVKSSQKGDKVRVALSGPEVVMTLEEWRKWLEERLEAV